jgi:nitrate/nitrite transport system ATP-binding protein
VIDIPRPRDRLALNHDAHFKRLRKDILDWLMASASRNSATSQRAVRLPAITPENLTDVTWVDRAFPRRTASRPVSAARKAKTVSNP